MIKQEDPAQIKHAQALIASFITTMPSYVDKEFAALIGVCLGLRIGISDPDLARTFRFAMNDMLVRMLGPERADGVDESLIALISLIDIMVGSA